MLRRYRWLLLAAPALGIVSTVAVAWLCSYRAEGIDGDAHVFASQARSARWTGASGAPAAAIVCEDRWRGLTYVRFFRRPPDDYYVRDALPVSQVAPPWAKPILPALLDRLPPVPDSRVLTLETNDTPELLIAAGWPWPALTCHAKSMFTFDWATDPENSSWSGPGVDHVISGGFSIPRGYRAADSQWALQQPPNLVVPLPYRPLWPGLLLDSLLFTTLWAALLFLPVAPFTLRAHLRRRRNLCPHCAYNLQGLPPLSPCPECGRL